MSKPKLLNSISSPDPVYAFANSDALQSINADRIFSEAYSTLDPKLVQFSSDIQRSPRPSSHDRKPTESLLHNYRQYFDTSTQDLLKRIKYAIYPFLSDYYDYDFWRTNNETRYPDLYGIVWIPFTWAIILSQAIGAAQYIDSIINHKTWSPMIALLPFCLTFSGASTIGTASLVWALCKAANIDNAAFIDVLSLSSYAMSSYTIVSIFCILPFPWSRLLAILLCGLIACRFIFLHLKSNIYACLSRDAASLEDERAFPQFSNVLVFCNSQYSICMQKTDKSLNQFGSSKIDGNQLY